MAHTPENKQGTEAACERDQISDLFEKNFQVVIRNMFIELKETMMKDMMTCP